MTYQNVPESFVSLRRAASHLGVPMNWLRAETKAGRLPHLKVGRGVRFNLDEVEQALNDRSATGVTYNGMPLRDWFAGQVMISAIPLAEKYALGVDEVVHDAYLYADAMIKFRERGEPSA